MDILLRGLLADIEGRCTSLQGILSALPDDPLSSAHVLESYHTLELAKRDASGLRSEPTLTEPTLRPNYTRLYQRLAERVRLVEFMVLPFVVRFDDGDRFLTRLTRRLIKEAAIPIGPPLVCAISNAYYWTFPSYSVIGVPAGEMNSLLGLPDLCHEVGHVLLDKFEATLIDAFPDRLADHVRGERMQLVADQRPPEMVAAFELHFEHWSEEWLLEFVSDMIGAYLAGVAYGLQHVRLCATWGNSLYAPGIGEYSEHPADRARVDAIIEVLRLIDPGGTSASLVAAWWGDFVAAAGEPEPAEHRRAYPAALIESLARMVVDGCRSLGITPESDASNGSVVRAMTKAWSAFRADPEGYPEYERKQLIELRNT